MPKILSSGNTRHRTQPCPLTGLKQSITSCGPRRYQATECGNRCYHTKSGKANFNNTIEAFEESGELLDRVVSVFGNMLSAETNDDLQELAQKIMPLLSEHSNNITLNEKLFARVKEVYDQKETLQLTQEQSQLLENAYNSFVRHGANLEGEAREEYRKLTTELSKLTLDFSENNLKETNSYQMLLTKKKALPDYRRLS